MTENIKPTLGLPKAEVTAAAPKDDHSPVAAKPESKPKTAKSSGPWGEVQQVKASGTTFADATQLESTGPWTLISVLASDQVQATDKTKFVDVQQGVILPIGAAISDLVELYCDGNLVRVFPPKDEVFEVEHDQPSLDVGSSAMFRKITDKGWRYVAGA